MCDFVEFGIALLGRTGDGLARWAVSILREILREMTHGDPPPVRPARRGVPANDREQRDLYDPPSSPRLPYDDDGWDVV